MTFQETFPTLLPEDLDGQSWYGFIEAGQEEYEIRVVYATAAPERSFECDNFLAELMVDYRDMIKHRLLNAPDLNTFLSDLKNIVEQVLSTQHKLVLPPPAFYNTVLKHIDEIGWERVVRIDEKLRTLAFNVTDSRDRKHELELHLKPAYPQQPPVCAVDCPRPLELDWSPNSNLASILQQFEALLERFQTHWEVMEDLDENTWVLEPSVTSYALSERRIALGNHCSLQLTIDPERPREVPDWHFMGADRVVTPLQDKLNARVQEDWDVSRLPRENLETIMELEFPEKSETRDDATVECGICYAYDFEGLKPGGPDKVCNTCGRPFHGVCVLEWFSGMEGLRRSMSTIFGTCPYCAGAMTLDTSKVRMPKVD